MSALSPNPEPWGISVNTELSRDSDIRRSQERMPRCIHLKLGGRQEECGILEAKSRKHSRGERSELGQILLMATKVEA